MDRALRELERSCEEARGDATLWARLARARLRAGLRPAEALAAVRAGLKANPASVDVAQARDEALAGFWKEPSFRELWSREGTTGERVAFSADGGQVAVASPGVVVLKVDENEIAGAGLAGQSIPRVTFMGANVVVSSGMGERIALFSPRTGEARYERLPLFVCALASAADGSRGIAVLVDRVLRFTIAGGKIRVTDEVLVPPVLSFPCPLVGERPEDDVVVLNAAHDLLVLEGARFDRKTVLAERLPREFESGLWASKRHVVFGGHASARLRLLDRERRRRDFDLAGEVAAMAPLEHALVAFSSAGFSSNAPRPPRFVNLDAPEAQAVPLCREPLVRVCCVACSPCGSRFAVVTNQGLTIFEVA